MKKKINHFPIGIYIKPENPNRSLGSFGCLPTLIESKTMIKYLLSRCTCSHCAIFWLRELKKA